MRIISSLISVALFISSAAFSESLYELKYNTDVIWIREMVVPVGKVCKDPTSKTCYETVVEFSKANGSYVTETKGSDSLLVNALKTALRKNKLTAVAMDQVGYPLYDQPLSREKLKEKLSDISPQYENVHNLFIDAEYYYSSAQHAMTTLPIHIYLSRLVKHKSGQPLGYKSKMCIQFRLAALQGLRLGSADNAANGWAKPRGYVPLLHDASINWAHAMSGNLRCLENPEKQEMPTYGWRREHSLKEIGRTSLKTLLYQDVLENNIKAYKDQSFSQPLTEEEVKQKTHRKDTVYTENQSTGEFERTVREYPFVRGIVKISQFRQLWWYDTSTNQFYIKTLGAELVRQKRKENGEIDEGNYEKLFWIKFN